jgi:hypothetical protein
VYGGFGRTHLLFVERELFAQAANLLLFKFTETFLAPPLTDANQHAIDQHHDTAFLPQVGNDFGAPAFFDKRALHEIGRAHLLLMALGNRQMIETGRRVIE